MQPATTLLGLLAQGLLPSVEKLQALPGQVRRLGHQDDGEKVVGLQSQKQVRVQGQVLAGFQSLTIPAGKGGQGTATAPLQIVGMGALPRRPGANHQVVMLVQWRVAVQSRVHEGQMIGLTVVLNRQFVIAVNRQLQGAADGDIRGQLPGKAASRQRLPALGDRMKMGSQRWRIPGQVNEHHAQVFVAADLPESVLAAVKTLSLVHAHAPYIGRGLQLAVQVVAPAVVGAANQQAGLGGLTDQLHTAVTANIVENTGPSVVVTNHQQGQLHKAHRYCVSWGLEITGEANGCPGVSQYAVTLPLPEFPAGVGFVAETPGLAEVLANHGINLNLHGFNRRSGVGHGRTLYPGGAQSTRPDFPRATDFFSARYWLFRAERPLPKPRITSPRVPGGQLQGNGLFDTGCSSPRW